MEKVSFFGRILCWLGIHKKGKVHSTKGFDFPFFTTYFYCKRCGVPVEYSERCL